MRALFVYCRPCWRLLTLVQNQKNPVWICCIYLIPWIINILSNEIEKSANMNRAYTNSLVNANLFYTNITNTQFHKVKRAFCQQSPVPEYSFSHWSKIRCRIWICSTTSPLVTQFGAVYKLYVILEGRGGK